MTTFLKERLKRLVRVTAVSLLGILLTALFVAGTIKIPNIHQRYIRGKVASKVVKVVRNNNYSSGGTGFHVKAKSGKTFILTNHHVCRVAGDDAGPGTKVTVITSSGELRQRKVVAIYPTNDLCLVEPDTDVEGLSVSSSFEIGDVIAAIGHPSLQPVTLSKGEIVSKAQVNLVWGTNMKEGTCEGPTYHSEKTPEDFAALTGVKDVCFRTLVSNLTTITILPGNSGSPVVDNLGRVVGVIFSGPGADGANWGGAIPLEDVKEFLSAY